METTKVGFRFDPTDVELIDYYLKNKILGEEWLVHDTISEINVCKYDPAALPALAILKSKDNVWHFISPKEYTSAKKVSRKRSTPSGFWKPTGHDRKVKVESAVIGTKRTLTYRGGNSSNAVWTIHEYEITSLPLVDQNYVLCKLFYKVKARDIPSRSNSTEPSHSLATEVPNPATAAAPQAGEESLSYFSGNDVTMIMNEPEDICLWDNNPNAQLPDDGEFLGALVHVNRKDVEFLFTDDQEPITQESCDEYLLKWLG